MKQVAADGMQMQPSSGGGGSRTGMSTTRSAVDKEKTKMRERQRRSITTKIFNGLRKHGGYRLSPRADINEVLRQLASEAGWTVDPDGTTYRSTSTSTSNVYNVCAACGAGIRSGTPTPTSSFIGAGVGGECSTTASPRQLTGGDSMLPYAGHPTSLYYSGISSGGGGGSAIVSGCGISSSPHDPDIPRGVYAFGRPSTGGLQSSSAVGGVPSMEAYQQQQQFYLQEARASNQNTPVGSPQRHV